MFNGDFTVTKIDNVTYTYPRAPARTARAGASTPSAICFQTGDQVYVGSTCPAFSAYSTFTLDASCNDSAPWVKPVTRVDADNFDYDLNGAGSATLTNVHFYAYGLRQVGSVRGRFGSNTVLVNLPNHGYGPNGTILQWLHQLWFRLRRRL